MMASLQNLLIRAESSAFYLAVLNFVLARFVPFNRPHGIALRNITPEKVEAFIPYKKSNFNHIKTVHACGLATVSEFCSGILLLRHVDAGSYRLIMKSFSTEFLYQARNSVKAVCSLSKEDLQSKVLDLLASEEAFFIDLEVDCFDTDNNHCSKTLVSWQLKPWKKVQS